VPTAAPLLPPPLRAAPLLAAPLRAAPLLAAPLLAGPLLLPFTALAGPSTPVTDAMLRDPAPADWLMFRRTYDDWGYSPLDEIDRANVAGLALVWSRDLEDESSQEGTPLVHDGVMYFPEPLDVVTAMDAATGKTLWQYRRKLPEHLARYVPNPQTNRSLAIYDRLVFDLGSDDFIYALDAETGELVWETKIVDYEQHPAKQGSGPLVVNGKLISGRNCMPQGGPEACVITAHDARTGKELWRLHTIPRPEQPGGDSWGDVPYEQRWHVGAWMVPSFDPELDLVYMGTSVTAPAPKFMLSGNDRKYLYHNSTLAIDPEHGTILPGTTSISSTTGISITRSSGCSSTRPSRRIPPRCHGSTRASSPGSGAAS
jgi:alcohol dehydrogenase (cytochrome c)